MSHPANNPFPAAGLPQAKVERNRKTYLFWLIPIAAAALAAYFIYSEKVRHGPTLHLYFENVAGLEPGKSQLKYRGAQMGLLEKMRLTRDGQRVELTVSLDRSAENLAREGSRFWVVKPEVSVGEIRGLRTIVSGDYLTVEPGTGKRRTEFVGLPEPPVIDPRAGLTIMLLSEKAGSLKKGSPVFYRGIQVGEVSNCRLGPLAQVVQSTVNIDRRFAPLVRLNSRFWNAGGINFSFGLSGADITAQSAQTLLSGGIAFATPDQPGGAPPPGTSFRLYDKPEDAWLSWAPAIPLPDKTTAQKPEEISR